MPSHRKQIRLFVASPSDVRDEGERVRKLVKELNQPGGVADQFGYTLQVLDWWENVMPSMGSPEEVIWEQLNVSTSDIFIGILWTRFDGTWGGQDAEKGFQLAYDAWQKSKRPHIMFYRCQRACPPHTIDPQQFIKVHGFWKEFEAGGAYQGVVRDYTEPEKFEQLVRRHLQKFLSKLDEDNRSPERTPDQSKPANQTPVDPEIELTDIRWTERDRKAVDYFWRMYDENERVDPDDEDKVLSWMRRNKLLQATSQGPRFTLAGALLFGPKDMLRVRTDVYVSGDSRGDENKYKRFEGLCLLRLVEELMEYLADLWQEKWEDPSKRDPTGKPLIFRSYPQVAIQEAIVNFVIHRDYKSGDSAYIDIKRDSIRFTNPGSTPYDIEKFLQPEAEFRPAYQRNKLIIQTFTRTRLNQTQRRGLWRIQKALLENESVFDDGTPALEIINQKEENRFCIVIHRRNKPKSVPFLAPPKPPYNLVGRDELLSQLKQRLFAGGNLALSALNGLPGVGKTALAVELAHDPEVLAHFRDGVLWAGLGREPDVSAQLIRWGVALGISFDEMAKLKTVGSKVDRVRAAIGTRQMLLVVDDAWQTEAALTFRLGGPNCAHLLTTRFPEIALDFAGDSLVVPELSHADGLMFLKRLAPQVVDAEPEEAQELVQAVGGLPLALVLMGNYLKIQGRNSRRRRIRNALDRLKQAEQRVKLAELQVAAQRHPSLPEGAAISMDAIIAISYEALNEASRRTLRALSVFPPKPNSFSEEAAEVVSDESVETLDTLYDYGLLEYIAPERYTLHQTIADYASLKCGRDERVLFEQRAADYFAAFAQQHSDSDGYRLLDLDWRNIVSSLEWAYEHKQWPTLVDGVQGLTRHNLGVVGFMDARGYWGTARELLARGLEGARALGDPHLEASILTKMGAFAFRRADFDVAKGYMQGSYRLLSQLPTSEDVVLQRVYLYESMSGLEMQRDPLAARKWVEQGLAELNALHTSEATYQKGYFYILLATFNYDAGRLTEAIVAAEQGLALLPTSPTSARIIALIVLGNVYSLQGDIEKSLEYQKEGIKIAQDLGDRRREAMLWVCIGLDEGNRGNLSAAVEHFQKTLELYQNIGDVGGKVNSNTNLGVFYILLGEDKRAERHLTTAIDFAQTYQLIKSEAYARTYLANLLIYQGKLAEATFALHRAHDICTKLMLPFLLPVVLYWQAEIARLTGQFDQALTLIEESLQRAEKAGYLLEKGIAWSIKGKILDAMQRFDEAEGAHQTSLQILEQYPYEVAQSQQALAEHYMMRDGLKSDRAKLWLTEALAAFERLGAKRDIARTKALLR
ncbi:MAG: NB-ARC domain-containing protein [Ardenticatenaceae bacterium]